MRFELPYREGIVGLSPELKAEADKEKEELSDIFDTLAKKKHGEFEVEKDELEIEMIQFANTCLNEYLESYGRKGVDIPLEYVHVLKEGGVKELTKGHIEHGGYSPRNHTIIVDRSPSIAHFTVVVFHELVHLKSFNTQGVSISPKGGRRLVPRRSGLTISSGERTMAFKDFDEALTSLFERRFFEEKARNHLVLSDEINEMERKGLQRMFSRSREFGNLQEMISILYEKNKEEFGSIGQIEDLFIDAKLNGSLLPIARLIEKTFGKGSFRRIAEEN